MNAQATVNDLAHAITLYERLEDHLEAMTYGDDLKDLMRQAAQRALENVRNGDMDALAGLKKAVQGLEDNRLPRD